MTDQRVWQHIIVFSLLSLAVGGRTSAQQDPISAAPIQTPTQPPGANVPVAPVPERLLTNFLEVGGSYQDLSNDFGHWSGGYAHAVLERGKNIWSGEVNGEHEFGGAGVYLAAGDTYNFNSDWYASLTVGSSVGGFFWPRFRTDGFINRKWKERKQFITTLGVGYYAAKDVHRDHSIFLGTIYYFQKPWILEDGLRFNVSNPGTVLSPSGFVAVTEGHNKRRYITLRAGFGQEAYQLIGPTVALTRFPSQTFDLTLRQWVGKGWGFNFVASYYHSPFYVRGGGSIGIFKDF
jgi:YaiO family outer membrane protein